jgi:hypothetical protein
MWIVCLFVWGLKGGQLINGGSRPRNSELDHRAQERA